MLKDFARGVNGFNGVIACVSILKMLCFFHFLDC